MRRWWCLADGCQVQTGVDGGIDLVFSFGEAFLAVNNHGVFFSKILPYFFQCQIKVIMHLLRGIGHGALG